MLIQASLSSSHSEALHAQNVSQTVVKHILIALQLNEEEKRLAVEKYQAHTRRALGILHIDIKLEVLC